MNIASSLHPTMAVALAACANHAAGCFAVSPARIYIAATTTNTETGASDVHLRPIGSDELPRHYTLVPESGDQWRAIAHRPFGT